MAETEAETEFKINRVRQKGNTASEKLIGETVHKHANDSDRRGAYQ